MLLNNSAHVHKILRVAVKPFLILLFQVQNGYLHEEDVLIVAKSITSCLSNFKRPKKLEENRDGEDKQVRNY